VAFDVLDRQAGLIIAVGGEVVKRGSFVGVSAATLREIGIRNV